MNIVIPLNGEGTRFSTVGYSDPKPLVRVMDREIIFWLLDALLLDNDAFAEDDINIIIAYNASLHAHNFVDRVEKRYNKRSSSSSSTSKLRFLPINFDTCGAAETIALALQSLSSYDSRIMENPAVCLDGDVWYSAKTLSRILGHVKTERTNCVVVQSITHDDPGKTASPYSHVMIGDDDCVLDIVEKVRVSDLACTGMYIFDSSKRLLNTCIELLCLDDDNKKINAMQFGELYMSSLIKHDIIHHGATYHALRVTADNDDTVCCFGTPEHIKDYLAMINQEDDAASCTNNRSIDTGSTSSTKNDYDNTNVMNVARTRRFHTVTIDKVNGIVTKIALTDSAARGLANQVRYYQLAAANGLSQIQSQTQTVEEEDHVESKWRIYFPIILDAAGGWYQMQYIPGDTLAALFTSQRMTCDDLRQVLNTLDNLHHRSSPLPPSMIPSDLLYNNYAPKLLHRMRLLDDDTIIQTEMVQRCITYFEKTYRTNDMGRCGCVHGDPVLSNIIKHVGGEIVFIDVRAGQFSAFDKCERFSMQGDILYDYAKVYQSIAGYDEILEGTQVPIKYRAEMINVLCEHVAKEMSPEHVVAMKHAAALLLFSLLPLHPKELRPAFVSLAQHIIVTLSF